MAQGSTQSETRSWVSKGSDSAIGHAYAILLVVVRVSGALANAFIGAAVSDGAIGCAAGGSNTLDSNITVVGVNALGYAHVGDCVGNQWQGASGFAKNALRKCALKTREHANLLSGISVSVVGLGASSHAEVRRLVVEEVVGAVNLALSVLGVGQVPLRADQHTVFGGGVLVVGGIRALGLAFSTLRVSILICGTAFEHAFVGLCVSKHERIN